MNENIDLTKILKDCPRGWKLYSLIHGEVQFGYIEHGDFPITVELSDSSEADYTKDGRLYRSYDGECVLLPSKNQRDWSKFSAPWYKKDKFDPKTLQPFDKVLVRNDCSEMWRCNFFSHISGLVRYPYATIEDSYRYCRTFNDDTIYIAGARKEVPEYYRYWED